MGEMHRRSFPAADLRLEFSSSSVGSARGAAHRQTSSGGTEALHQMEMSPLVQQLGSSSSTLQSTAGLRSDSEALQRQVALLQQKQEQQSTGLQGPTGRSILKLEKLKGSPALAAALVLPGVAFLLGLGYCLAACAHRGTMSMAELAQPPRDQTDGLGKVAPPAAGMGRRDLVAGCMDWLFRNRTYLP